MGVWINSNKIASLSQQDIFRKVSVETVFVGVVCSEKSGAEGLLDSLCNSLKNIKQSKKSWNIYNICINANCSCNSLD